MFEGQHILVKAYSAGAFESSFSPRSQGEGKHDGQQALDSQVPEALHMEMDVHYKCYGSLFLTHSAGFFVSCLDISDWSLSRMLGIRCSAD